MKIGDVRISKADGPQNLDLQKDALVNAGILAKNIYEDQSSGSFTTTSLWTQR